MRPLIIIAGPTATGKSDLAIDLAEKLNGEIISADSMQIYKYMDIGTAKIDLASREKIRHYMIDEINPDQNFSVADYKTRADFYLNKIYGLKKVPILCGGTGFYINAVLKNIDFLEQEINLELRKKLFELDNIELKKRLFDIDPVAAENIHENNKKKIIRAIEFFYATNKKISEHNLLEKQKKSAYNDLFIILNLDRCELYKRINYRVDKMIEDGLINEVKNLLDMGYHKNLISMQGIGYKEIVLYLEKNISLEQAIDLIKKNSRNYAKRQVTWFKHQVNGIWLDKNKFSSNKEILDCVLDLAYKKFGKANI